MPASEWAVDQVAVTNGDPYCTLKRQYDANASVTFARNIKGEGTIALDFQRDVFDRTRSYPITLQAGQVIRQYIIKPASKSAIIMRTSTDASLFEAMRSAGDLTIQIDDERFTLNLSNYTQGFEKLTSCVGQGAAQVVADVEVPRPPKVVNQVADQDNLSDQETRISELVKRNQELVDNLENERAQFRRQIAASETQAAQPSSLPAPQVSALTPTVDTDMLNKLAAAEKSNADLLKRIASLESQVASQSAEVNPNMDDVLKKRYAQIDALEGDNARLKSLYEQEKASREKLQAQVDKLTREKTAQASTGASDALVQQLQSQIETLTAQNKTLSDRLAQAASAEPKVVVKEIIKEVPMASANTPEQLAALNEELAETKTEALSLKAERDEYRNLLQRERQRMKEMSDIGTSVSDTGAQSQSMITQIQKLEAEKVDLIRQLEFAKKQTPSSPSSSVADQSDMEDRLAEITKESEQAKADLRQLASQKKELESELRRAEIAMAEAQKAVTDAKMSRMANADTSNDTMIQSLEAEIASLEAQNRILREDVAAKANQVQADTQNNNYEAEIAAIESKYQKRMNTIEQENIRLARELDAQKKTTITWKEPVPQVEPSTTVSAPMPIVSAPTPIVSAPVKKVEAPVQVATIQSSEPVPTQTKTQPMKVVSTEASQPQVTPNEARRRLRDKIMGNAVPSVAAVTYKDPTPMVLQPLPSDDVPVVETVSVPVQQQAPKVQMATLSGDEIKQLITAARIPLASGIERISTVSGPDFAAFRWDTGNVYGSGEQSKLATLNGFENAVQHYISKTESRCEGQFDKTITPINAPNGIVARMADIACIQGSDGAGASIIFFAHNGMFYAMAHESDMNSFQTAMEHRDQLARNLTTIF